jgi:hypothetical protein
MEGFNRIKSSGISYQTRSFCKGGGNLSRFQTIELSNQSIFSNTINIVKNNTLINSTEIVYDIHGLPTSDVSSINNSFYTNASGDYAINNQSIYYKDEKTIYTKKINNFSLPHLEFNVFIDLTCDELNNNVINLGNINRYSDTSFNIVLTNINNKNITDIDIELSSNLSILSNNTSLIIPHDSGSLSVECNTDNLGLKSEYIIISSRKTSKRIIVNYEVIQSGLGLFVSVNGNDNNNGSENNPLRTISKALDIIDASSYRTGIHSYIYLMSGINSPMSNRRHLENTSIIGLPGSKFIRGFNNIDDPINVYIKNCYFDSSSQDTTALPIFVENANYNGSGTSICITNTRFDNWLFAINSTTTSPATNARIDISGYCIFNRCGLASGGQPGVVLGLACASGSTISYSIFNKCASGGNSHSIYHWNASNNDALLMYKNIVIGCGGENWADIRGNGLSRCENNIFIGNNAGSISCGAASLGIIFNNNLGILNKTRYNGDSSPFININSNNNNIKIRLTNNLNAHGIGQSPSFLVSDEIGYVGELYISGNYTYNIHGATGDYFYESRPLRLKGPLYGNVTGFIINNTFIQASSTKLISLETPLDPTRINIENNTWYSPYSTPFNDVNHGDYNFIAFNNYYPNNIFLTGLPIKDFTPNNWMNLSLSYDDQIEYMSNLSLSDHNSIYEYYEWAFGQID